MDDQKSIKENLTLGSADSKKKKIKIKKKQSESEKTQVLDQDIKSNKQTVQPTASKPNTPDITKEKKEASSVSKESSLPLTEKQSVDKSNERVSEKVQKTPEPIPTAHTPTKDSTSTAKKSPEKSQPPPTVSKTGRNPIVSRPNKKPDSQPVKKEAPPLTRPQTKSTDSNYVPKGARPIILPTPEMDPSLLTSQQSNISTKKKGGFEKGKKEEQILENAKFFKQNFKKPKPQGSSTSSVPKEISIMENIQVGELAKKLNLKPGEVIGKLMRMGLMVTINNVIDAETATLLADEYGCKVNIVSLYEQTVIEEEKDNPEDLVKRPPVVTIMGHVDHGKTKLLDTIRSSRVAEMESGGITQHIGAYQVNTPKGTVTFLDTPGHEAFTSMRARGASVTDIVVLVVAADDSVKPQTIEAINHARAANVPIIVAINKIDLPTANVNKVKEDLSIQGLQPEDWGGSTICCEISAKNNIGIDHLLDMILLQADIMELKANPKRRAKGTIIEAKLDPGRGPVATVLVQTGTLRIGDPFVAGTHYGRVRAMFNDLGQNIKEAGPSTPVLVTGLEAVPDAGAPFDVVKDEREAKMISQSRKEYERIGQAGKQSRVTLETMNDIIKQGGLKELKVIIKADVRGSSEAVKEALEKLSTNDVKLTVIHAGTGAIVDSDVMLASASNAIIIGFHTRANPKTLSLAEKEKVEIKYYSIIYDVVNDIKSAMEGLLEPEKIEKILGQAEIREIFKITKVGNIAGSFVTSGKITKNANVRVISKESGDIIFEGKIKSLRRLKDDVNEVQAGLECGILLDNFNQFEVGDTIEAYEINEIAKKL